MFARYWKAAIAFLTPLVVLLSVVSGSEAIRAAAPGATAWIVAVGLPAVTGLLTLLKRNAQLPQDIDYALSQLPADEVKALLAKYRA